MANAVQIVLIVLARPSPTELMFRELGHAARQDVLEEVDGVIEQETLHWLQSLKLRQKLHECGTQAGVLRRWDCEQQKRTERLRTGFEKLVRLEQRGELEQFRGVFHD